MAQTNRSRLRLLIMVGAITSILYICVIVRRKNYIIYQAPSLKSSLDITGAESNLKLDYETEEEKHQITDRLQELSISDGITFENYIRSACHSNGPGNLNCTMTLEAMGTIENGVKKLNDLLSYLRLKIKLDLDIVPKYISHQNNSEKTENRQITIIKKEDNWSGLKNKTDGQPRLDVPRLFIDSDFWNRSQKIDDSAFENVVGLRLSVSGESEVNGTSRDAIPYRIPNFYPFTLPQLDCNYLSSQSRYNSTLYPCNGSKTNLTESLKYEASKHHRTVYTSTSQSHIAIYIMRDAIVRPVYGTVMTAKYTYVTSQCNQFQGRSGTEKYFSSRKDLKHLKEVFVTFQYWANGVFHYMVEAGPRMAPFIDFLKSHPDIKIHAPRKRLTQRFFTLYGIDPGRVVSDTIWADIVYLPQGGGCGCSRSCIPCLQVLADIAKRFDSQKTPDAHLDKLKSTLGCNNKLKIRKAEISSKINTPTTRRESVNTYKSTISMLESETNVSGYSTDHPVITKAYKALSYSRSNSSKSTGAINQIVLIQRTGKRSLSNHCQVESLLQRLALEFGMVYLLYPDSPLPDLNTTLDIFRGARVVVAPHGAGLANMVFSSPGTFVVEVLVKEGANFCYKDMSYQLGHRWHGIVSLTTKPKLSVDMVELESALRTYFQKAYTNKRLNTKNLI